MIVLSLKVGTSDSVLVIYMLDFWQGNLFVSARCKFTSMLLRWHIFVDNALILKANRFQVINELCIPNWFKLWPTICLLFVDSWDAMYYHAHGDSVLHESIFFDPWDKLHFSTNWTPLDVTSAYPSNLSKVWLLIIDYRPRSIIESMIKNPSSNLGHR